MTIQVQYICLQQQWAFGSWQYCEIVCFMWRSHPKRFIKCIQGASPTRLPQYLQDSNAMAQAVRQVKLKKVINLSNLWWYSFPCQHDKYASGFSCFFWFYHQNNEIRNVWQAGTQMCQKWHFSHFRELTKTVNFKSSNLKTNAKDTEGFSWNPYLSKWKQFAASLLRQT